MELEHMAHINHILTQFNKELVAKYKKGQEEHGGQLWLKPGLLDNAIEEVIDLVVYLYTLREQQETEKADRALRSMANAVTTL